MEGAEQRRRAGGSRLALSEPQASLASRPACRVAQGTGAAGADPHPLALRSAQLTLRQTGKMDDDLPVVLYDSKFWKGLINFEAFVAAGMVNRADLDLFSFADSPREAWEQLVKRGLKLPGV